MKTEIVIASTLVVFPLVLSLLFRKVLRFKYPRIKGWVTGVTFSIILLLCFLCLSRFQQELIELIECEDTVYAPSFTESNFRKVRIGMSKEEVEGLLGQPLEKFTVSKKEMWRYSGPGPPEINYRIRIVKFIDERVCEIYSEFYLD